MEAYISGYYAQNHSVYTIPLPYWLPANTQITFNIGSKLGQKG